MSPTAMEGTLVTYQADTYINLTASYASTAELTFTAQFSANGHLLVTPHLSQAATSQMSIGLTAYYSQNNQNNYIGDLNVYIPAGSTDGQTLDCGNMGNLVSGNFTVQLHTRSVSPTAMEGTLVTYQTDTYINLTKP